MASWGERGVPLLPYSLRSHWADETLPTKISSKLGLPSHATFSDLDHFAWDNKLPRIPATVRDFLLANLRHRRRDIKDVVAVPTEWPADLDPRSVPWSVRTRNCLKRRGRYYQHDGSLGRLRELETITFGELLKIRNFGVVSLLDFSCTLEAVLVDSGSQMGRDRQETLFNEGLDPGARPVEEVVDEAKERALRLALEEDWMDGISGRDPRFRPLLTRRGSLRSIVEDALSNHSVEGIERAMEQMETCKQIYEDLATLSLEGLLGDVLERTARVEDERKTALMARLGWNGLKPVTLREAGEKIGLSRERIRQIEKRLKQGIHRNHWVMPALTRAIRLLNSNVPLSVMQASDLLNEKGVSNRSFHPEGVLSAAELFRLSCPVRVVEVFDQRLVLNEEEIATAKRVLKAAKKLTRASGATSLFALEENLSGGRIDRQEIAGILCAHGDVRFVDESWFFVTSERSATFETASRKMLAVNSPLHISTLREGLRRVYRFRSSSHSEGDLQVPPRRVLLELYDRYEAFQREGSHVHSTEPLDPRKELSEAEIAMIDVFRSQERSILDRASFLRECVERGVNRNTANVYSSFSPIIKHVGIDLWSIRGEELDPAQVEAFRSRIKPRTRRILGAGWTEDGLLWVAFRVPDPVQSSVFKIPAGFERYLAERSFDATIDPAVPCGTITVYDSGMSGGYGAFLSRTGADEGDVMIARFDLVKEEVSLELTDDEGLDDAS